MVTKQIIEKVFSFENFKINNNFLVELENKDMKVRFTQINQKILPEISLVSNSKYHNLIGFFGDEIDNFDNQLDIIFIPKIAGLIKKYYKEIYTSLLSGDAYPSPSESEQT